MNTCLYFKNKNMTTFSILASILILFLLFWILVLCLKLREEKKKRGEVSQECADKEALGKVNTERIRIKNERKEMVLGLIKENGRVSNDEVEKLLNVADSTVTNYLDELEKEGRIRQVGRTGQGVYYELNG